MVETETGKTATAVAKDDLFIPLIDFSKFLTGTGSDKTTTAEAVLHGFQNAGFIYLENHGISPELVTRIFELSAQFFKRPQEQKDQLPWTAPESNRGYSGMGREKTTSLTDMAQIQDLRENVPDLKESFEIGREDEPGMPNSWPDRFDEQGQTFKTEMIAFHDTCKELHVQVMRALALGLGIDERWFDSYCDGGDNTLRLLHYPPAAKSVFKKNVNQVRAGAHSDYGSITLLFQDSRGGLQVKSPRGNFVDATPIPNTIVVNAGDLLARWSNATIKSTVHRVVEPPMPEDGEVHPARYSIAYFCNPNFDRLIDAIPGTYATESDKRYAPVNSGAYLVQRLTETY